MGSRHRYACRSSDQSSTRLSLCVLFFFTLFQISNFLVPQNAALAKAEQERAASEEEERRLKAKLTAKREPSVNPSRLASPAISGTSTEQVKDATSAAEESQDVAMDPVEPSTLKPEEPQWLPQLVALFDDVKKIAPPGAIEAIGLVL
jgi:THO complex subunit 2